MMAAAEGHTETATALLAAPSLDKNATNGDVMTAVLALADADGHVEIASLLRARPR